MTSLINSSQTQATQSETFSDYEIKATAYLFDRLRHIYLNKFDAQFKDERQLRDARREWAKRIGRLSREEIDRALEITKKEYEEGNKRFDWPSIALTIGCVSKNWQERAHKIYEPERLLEDQGKKERSRKAGVAALKEMKELTQ